MRTRSMWIAAMVFGSLTLLTAQEAGISVKKPVFGAACKICPWGAIAEIVKAAMQPYGYDVQICSTCSRADAPRIVAEGRMPPPLENSEKAAPYIPRHQRHPLPKGPIEFGATSVQNLWHAYQGTHAYAKEAPRKNLRLLANIQAPNYLMVAVRADSGITDLKQIKEKRWPVRIISGGEEGTAVLAHYGLTPDAITKAGGRVSSGSLGDPEGRKTFDVIIHGGSLATAPEFDVWYEVTQRYDLRFLQLPDDLLAKLATEFDMQRGAIPNGLLKGVERAIPTVVRTGHAVYGRDDMPADFAYAVARALDQRQELFQWSHLNLSYNVHTVWKAFEVPLHPGAAKYYRERGYMK